MNISIKNKLFFFAVITLLVSLITGCVKSDPYIDWKRMNDEWYTAHKTDGDIIKKLNWQVTNTPIYDKVTTSFQQSKSGFSYRVVRLGNPSDRVPNPTSYIVANYEKKLIDGTTFSKGTETGLGRVSSLENGLQEIILKMHHGDIYELYIPYELTFDSGGQVVNYSAPKYSLIIYRIELIDSDN